MADESSLHNLASDRGGEECTAAADATVRRMASVNRLQPVYTFLRQRRPIAYSENHCVNDGPAAVEFLGGLQDGNERIVSATVWWGVGGGGGHVVESGRARNIII